MSLDELATAPETAPFLEAILNSRRQPRFKLQWEAGRIDVLRQKAAAENIAVFERSCARGQLAAIDGDLVAAETELLTTLRDFRHLYPNNGHLFQHILQLALAMQALDLVALFLNDRHQSPGVFVVAFEESRHDPAINWVSVDDAGQCHFAVDPRIPGKHHADYFVAHWVSSAPLWASYCRSADWEPGRAPMNSGEAGAIPGLAYCGNRSDIFLLPDAYFIGTNGYADMRATYDAGRPKWQDRRPIAFWRGSTTGVRASPLDWQSLPRIRLARIGQANPDVLDVGLSGVVQTVSEEDRRQIEAAGLVKGRVPIEAFLKFKYQIDIDGNTNAWPGFYQKLLSGSPVLKVASPHGFTQWYYGRLRPWINYVPVSSDMTDLVDKVEWLQTHDDQARAIGEAGLALACALDYKRELNLAHKRIRAVFRWVQGKPETVIRFGSGCNSNENPGQGADEPDSNSVWAFGGHSLLSVQRPASTGEYEFSLDIEPNTRDPEVPAQHVTVLINDDVVVDTMLEKRRTISWILRDDIFDQHDALWILVLHPDGFAPSRYGADGADEVRSVAIHALSVVKKAVWRDLLGRGDQAVAPNAARLSSGSRAGRSRRVTVLRKAVSRHPVLVIRALNGLAAKGHRDLEGDDTFHLKLIEALIRRNEPELAAATTERLSAAIDSRRLGMLRYLIEKGGCQEYALDQGYIATAHKTVLVHNLFDGKLHHVPFDDFQPLPLGHCLVSLADVGQRRILTQRSEEATLACEIHENGDVSLVDIATSSDDHVIAQEDHSDFVALRIRGNYVCADRDGRVVYDRPRIQGWEKFAQTVAVRTLA